MSTKSNQVNQQSKEENFARDAAVSTQQVELDLSFVISCKKLSQLYKVVPLQGLTSWAKFILCHIKQKTIPTLQGGAATRSNKLSSIYPLPNHAENYTNVRPPRYMVYIFFSVFVLIWKFAQEFAHTIKIIKMAHNFWKHTQIHNIESLRSKIADIFLL